MTHIKPSRCNPLLDFFNVKVDNKAIYMKQVDNNSPFSIAQKNLSSLVTYYDGLHPNGSLIVYMFYLFEVAHDIIAKGQYK